MDDGDDDGEMMIATERNMTPLCLNLVSAFLLFSLSLSLSLHSVAKERRRECEGKEGQKGEI